MTMGTDEESLRFIAEIEEAIQNHKGFDPEIVLLEKKIHFMPFSLGQKSPADDQVHVIFYEDADPIRPIGAIRLTRAQWEKMKEEVEPHFSALTQMREEAK